MALLLSTVPLFVETKYVGNLYLLHENFYDLEIAWCEGEVPEPPVEVVAAVMEAMQEDPNYSITITECND